MPFVNKNQILIFIVLGTVLFLAGAGPGQARDPFFDPRPPIDAYDFPRAAEEVHLRGLVVMENDRFRALVYVRPRGEYLVLSPRDRFSVTVDDLRHEFRILGIGGRRLVLRGKDGEHYNIGVRESD